MAEVGLHGQLDLFCWDIFSESVYTLLEQESLLLDGKSTLTQNHLGKEQKIITLPCAPTYSVPLLTLPLLISHAF